MVSLSSETAHPTHTSISQWVRFAIDPYLIALAAALAFGAVGVLHGSLFVSLIVIAIVGGWSTAWSP